MNVEPLRAALRAQVDAETHRLDAEAAAACAGRLAEAREEARTLVMQGRREGEEAAMQERLRRRAVAGRRAREVQLEARRSLVDRLRRHALAAALDLKTDTRYPRLLDRLSATARAQLGADAVVELDPAGAGGLVARADRRYVDYTLPALVERAIDDLDGSLEALWL